MKRFLVAILAILYITLTSGVVVSVHYCMGKRSNVSIGNFSQKLCGCGPKENKKCCSSEIKIVKLDDNHQQAQADIQLLAAEQFLPQIIGTIIQINLQEEQPVLFTAHAPPVRSGQDILIQHSVFRI